MKRVVGFFDTTIGKKVLMAASGAVWIGYLVGHLLGNLQMFAGPEKINGYAAFLHDSPMLLWGTRGLLVATLVAHVVASMQLTMRNFEARPVAYRRKTDVATTYAARTMIWSGPILALFLVYHLLHLTLGFTPGHEFHEHDVYNNVVQGFQVWWVVIAYVVAQLALGLHLYHGLWSAFATIGAVHPRYETIRRGAATAITVAIIGGYLSIPLAVVAGVLEPAVPVHPATHVAHQGAPGTESGR